MIQTAILLLAILQVAPQAAGSKPPSEVEEIKLQRATNGVDGNLQLLLDPRLTASVRAQMWGKGEWSFVFPKDSVLYREFSARPPRKATLNIVDKEGKSIATRVLQTPLARIEKWNASSEANSIFLLAEDFSTGAGSYNGLLTTLIEISAGTLKGVKAINQRTGRQDPIRIMKSLKDNWRRFGEKEILAVSSHPRMAGGRVQTDFVIDYIRYQSDGTRWFEFEREVAGIWESDQGFPARSAFP